MTRTDVVVCAAGAVLTGWTCWMAFTLWIGRRQPIRREAPTGEGPWVPPDHARRLRVVPPESWRIQR